MSWEAVTIVANVVTWICLGILVVCLQSSHRRFKRACEMLDQSHARETNLMVANMKLQHGVTKALDPTREGK